MPKKSKKYTAPKNDEEEKKLVNEDELVKSSLGRSSKRDRELFEAMMTLLEGNIGRLRTEVDDFTPPVTRPKEGESRAAQIATSINDIRRMLKNLEELNKSEPILENNEKIDVSKLAEEHQARKERDNRLENCQKMVDFEEKRLETKAKTNSSESPDVDIHRKAVQSLKEPPIVKQDVKQSQSDPFSVDQSSHLIEMKENAYLRDANENIADLPVSGEVKVAKKCVPLAREATLQARIGTILERNKVWIFLGLLVLVVVLLVLGIVYFIVQLSKLPNSSDQSHGGENETN